MKKTKIVKIAAKPARKATPARTKEVTETVCDFCGASVPDHGSYGWYPSCAICGRDCCRKHNVAENDYMDYTDWYCIICAKIYPKLYEELAEKHYAEIEALKSKVKKESLHEQARNS